MIRAVGADDPQRISPLNPVEDLGDRLHDVPTVIVLQELGHYLGIGLGDEAHAFRLQEFLNLYIVFNDAVVDHGDAS